MLKLSDNPPVFADGLSPFASPGKWWVAHTRSRCEKALAWGLLDRQIPYLLPLVNRISISGGKKRRARIPLFPSHVFLKGGPEVRHQVLETGHACRVIEALDQVGVSSELQAIERAMDAGIRLDPFVRPLVGDSCRIIDGPLTGAFCTALQWGRLATVVLPISLLRRGALMQIDSNMLHRLPSARQMPVASAAARLGNAPFSIPAPAITRNDIDRLRIGKNYAIST